MESPTRLSSFEEYRQRIEALLALVEPSPVDAAPADPAALDHARIRMARIITAYHLFADRELFTPCAYALRDPAQKAQIKAVAAECATLAQDFRRWARDCQEGDVAVRWPAYRAEATAMATRIRRHIVGAEREVRRCLALGYGPGLCRAAA